MGASPEIQEDAAAHRLDHLHLDLQRRQTRAPGRPSPTGENVFRADSQGDLTAAPVLMEVQPRQRQPQACGLQPQLPSAGGNLPFQEVHLRRSHEPGHKSVGRPIVEIEGGIHLLEDPLVHDGNAVPHGHGLDLVMGHVDRGHSQPAVEPDELGPGGHPQLGIQVGQGFIHQERLGLADDGPPQSHPLALPAGKCLGTPPQHLLKLQHPGNGLDASIDILSLPLPGLAVEHPSQRTVGGRPKAQAEGQVFPDVHMGIEGVVLKHHGHVPVLGRKDVHPAVPDRDLSAGQLFQAGNAAQHRALTAARGPDQDQELPVGDLQAQVVHRCHFTEPLGEILQPDLGHGLQ